MVTTDMDLYRTAKGRWAGTVKDIRAATKDEGSKPGSWSKVKVPDRKPSRIDFLNSLSAAQEPTKDRLEPAPAPRTPKPSKNGHRWRVYGGRQPLFVGSAVAPTAEEAVQEMAATLQARLVTAR